MELYLVIHVIYCKRWWCTTHIWPAIYVKTEGFPFSNPWYPPQSDRQPYKQGILDWREISMHTDFSITRDERLKFDSPLPWFNLNVLSQRMASFLPSSQGLSRVPGHPWEQTGQKSSGHSQKHPLWHCLQGWGVAANTRAARFTAAAASRLPSWVTQILPPAGTSSSLWLQGESPVPTGSYGWFEQQWWISGIGGQHPANTVVAKSAELKLIVPPIFHCFL